MTRQDWVPDPGLVQEITKQFDRAIASYRANPNLISEHANHEESIRVGGYATRTLLELVQNAADAMSGISNDGSGESAGRVEIILDVENETLYCANAGRPFSKNGITAISHAYLSAKRGDEIGRFGLGFKSVLAVTDAPQVFSHSVSFEFNSPEAQKAIAGVSADAKRFPILRTATLANPDAAFEADPLLAELAEWATTIVKLPHAMNLRRLRDEIETFSSEFLLFVSSVREVRLRVLGEDEFKTSHISRDLGNGALKIESPDGSGQEWIVENRMHAPSMKARQEVGEAVSRHEVKITVAMPVHHSQQQIGRFWSYFPLQDETSASALFNAPWSVNDDRTTLLRNDYNREILGTLSRMFVDMLPRVSTTEDPAAHLDYLPARPREELSYGDRMLRALVPRLSTDVALIPDANRDMSYAAELRPLDFTSVPVDEKIHRAWTKSPNTGNDVPHWRCYSSERRFTRLRQLFAYGVNPELMEDGGRDMKRALGVMPKRGLLSWLREWAEGDSTTSAADACKFVIGHRHVEGIEQAKVIPTTGGLRALADRNEVFLKQQNDVEIEGAVFVDRDFLASPGMEDLLRQAGFRDLNPIAILNARVARLSVNAGENELSKLWDAVRAVSPRDAVRVIKDHQHVAVKVPTRDGEWAWPRQVIDLDEVLRDEFGSIMLDRERCSAEVAHALGVIRAPSKNYSIEDETLFEAYYSWVLGDINSQLGPGERLVERISLYPSQGFSPGPFSLLLILRDAGASNRVRETWTRDLLAFGDAKWDCEDVDSGVNYRVKSPVRWAIEQAGMVDSTRGYLSPKEVVAPSLVQYKDLLPLYIGPRSSAQVLGLPDGLEGVPDAVFRTALEAELFPPSIKDDLLTEFVLHAGSRAYAGAHPPRIPARVGRAIESCSPKVVYVAVTDEQREFLTARQRPFLRATEQQGGELVAVVGCRLFEDSFAFSMLIDGQQVSEPVFDVFTGIRSVLGADKVMNARVARAARVTKRVTTEDGVEDQSLEWHRDGYELVVQSDVSERRLLHILNDAFNLRLTNADLSNVLKAGLDHRLELMRQRALAAATDAQRLEEYFGDDDLRDELPKGLWPALEAQGLVDASTSIAKLYLTVYGSDSIKFLAELFRREGFPDVPIEWTGRARTISWLRKMGFGAEYAGRPVEHRDDEFVVPGAVRLSDLHEFQQKISTALSKALTERDMDGRARKAMVELPTGAGKTRVATETVLRLFIEGKLRGPVLWIAQSQELCEQAVQTWSMVWRGLRDERPLTIGRLWEDNAVHEPGTEFSVIVATDAKLRTILDNSEYDWLSESTAVIVDEGHRAGASELYTRILTWLGVAGHGWGRPLIGLSATPFKGRSAQATKALVNRFGNCKLSAFETNAYKELAELQVLAKVRHEVLPGVDVHLTPSERDEATSRGRISPHVLDRIGQDHARMSILVDHIMDLDPTWPVLVFTPNVLSAQVLAATLRYRGKEAASVSGQTGRQERRDVIDRFKDGEIRVLTNCELLTQGFDAPAVRALYIARPTFSPNAYIQMAGRGLRGPANGGKEECLIVDMADNFGDINELLGFREYEDLWQEQQA